MFKELFIEQNHLFAVLHTQIIVMSMKTFWLKGAPKLHIIKDIWWNTKLIVLDRRNYKSMLRAHEIADECVEKGWMSQHDADQTADEMKSRISKLKEQISENNKFIRTICLTN